MAKVPRKATESMILVYLMLAPQGTLRLHHEKGMAQSVIRSHGSGTTLSHSLLGGLGIILGAVEAGSCPSLHSMITDMTMAQGWCFCRA